MSDSSPATTPESRADVIATIGKYRVLAELARGGMGRVYLALAEGAGGAQKLLVLKTLHGGARADPASLRLFLLEGRIATRLNHPNIVQTYEAGRDEANIHYLAMEYLEGQSLRRILGKASPRGPVPLELQLRVFIDALSALSYAHELTNFDGTPLKIVHRDVSPQNLVVTYEGQVKLVDFGVAKARDDREDTKSGVLKGKLSYMAPEQMREAKSIDCRTDIFAMGILMWEAVAGKRLWEGMTQVEILNAVKAGKYPQLSLEALERSPRLAEIISRAMAPSPDDRYQTASALQEDLEEILPTFPEPSTNRALAKRVAADFADARLGIRTLIEKQLTLFRTAAQPPKPLQMAPLLTTNLAPDPLPRNSEGAIPIFQSPTSVLEELAARLDLTAETRLEGGVFPKADPPPADGSADTTDKEDADGAIFESPLGRIPAAEADIAERPSGTSSGNGTSSVLAASNAEITKRRLVMIAAAVFGGALAIVLLLVFKSNSHELRDVASTPPSASPSTSAPLEEPPREAAAVTELEASVAAADAAATVRYRVTTLPPRAELTIDGVIVPNPFDATFPAGSSVRVGVRAAGHFALAKSVVLSEDQEVVYKLDLIPGQQASAAVLPDIPDAAPPSRPEWMKAYPPSADVPGGVRPGATPK